VTGLESVDEGQIADWALDGAEVAGGAGWTRSAVLIRQQKRA